MRDCATFLHHYGGYTWETMMALRYGIWRVLVREVERQHADAAHRELVVQHSGDVKDLEERLRYAAHPEQAWWAQEPTPQRDVEAMLARIRRP